MAMYESNLEELSQAALIAMVGLYRKKEKLWKSSQYVPDDAEALVAAPSMVIPQSPLKPPKKETPRIGGRASSKASKPEHSKRHSTASLTKRYRQPGVGLGSNPTPQRKMEKISKDEGLQFVMRERAEHKDSTLGSHLSSQHEKPSFKPDPGSDGPGGRASALKNFIDASKSSPGAGNGSSESEEESTHAYFQVPEEEIKTLNAALVRDEAAVAAASTNEILARLNPDLNSFVLSSDEVSDFSPAFLQHLDRAKDNVLRFLEELRSFAEVSEHAASLNFRASRGMDNLAMSLFRLKNNMGEYGNTLLPNSINRFGEILSELGSVQKQLTTDLMKLVAIPVRTFAEEEAAKVSKLSKQFRKASEGWEQSLAKHMKKVTEVSDELDSDLMVAVDAYENISLEYVQKLNEIEVLGKMNLVSSITSYGYHVTEFTIAQQRLLEQSPPYLKAFGHYLTKSKSIINRRLPSLSSKIPRTDRPFDPKSKEISGYCHYAHKATKSKTVNWKLGFFEVAGGFLSHLQFQDGQLTYKKYPLLTSSVKPRSNVDRNLVLELNSMVGDLTQPDKLHPETLFLQISKPTLYRQWLLVLQNGIMDSLTGDGADDDATDTKQGARIRLPDDVQAAMCELNPICADCGSSEPTWAAINLGVMFCIECSGVHRAMGVRVSKVRSLTLDKWDRVSYQMMLELGNKKVNHLLEARLGTTLVTKPSPDAFRGDRERFIQAKYLDLKFVEPVRSEDHYTEAVHRAAESGDLLKLLSCILYPDCDVNCRDPRGFTPLHKTIKNKQYLAAQILITNGADIDLPTLDHESSTPLHLAAQNKDSTAIALLVSSGGADLSIRNSAGLLPYELLEKLTHDPLPEKYQRSFEGFDPGTYEPSQQPPPNRNSSRRHKDRAGAIRKRSSRSGPSKERRSRSGRGSDQKGRVSRDEESSEASMSASEESVKDKEKEVVVGVGKKRVSLGVALTPKGHEESSDSSSSAEADGEEQPAIGPGRTGKSAVKSRRSKSDRGGKKGALDETKRKKTKYIKSPRSSKGSDTEIVTDVAALPLPEGVQIEPPKLAQILQVSSPRNSQLLPVYVVDAVAKGVVGRSYKMQSTAVKTSSGEVRKGKYSDYEVDIMGPQQVDGAIVDVADDGAFVVKFTVEQDGQYFVQVYLNDTPIFDDYQEVAFKDKK